MITIYGRYANAIVYTIEDEQYGIDEYARKQLQMICNNQSAEGSKIRVMPDVHPGKVGTIGLTMTVGDSILPSLVGVDIGCGMNLVKINAKHVEFQKLDKVIRENVPVGGNVRKKAHKYSDDVDLKQLECYKAIDNIKAEVSIGTLGGGNHFIELDKDDDDNIYLIIHSGSRHLGIEVAEYYLKRGQKESQMKKCGFASYEMTCLTGDLKDAYCHDIAIIQKFAEKNREAMINEIVTNMKWKITDSCACIHNYIDFSYDIPILRKGSISARDGEKVIIPINMKDGVILGTGIGNEDWNFSAPHGAGRIFKRSEVKDYYTVSEFKKAMDGIHSICINKDTLDESPFAYRKINDIVNAIGNTVKIDSIIKPIYNFKAGGEN